MLDIFVRISSVDLGFTSREHTPTKEMEGSFVRVTNMDTIPELSGAEGYQLFHGIIVDTNGDDIGGEEVELVDHELDSQYNMPQLFGKKERTNEW